jgi:hypothetical protein
MIYLYLKTHNKTGLKYLGKTIAADPHAYSGSGTIWLRHLEKHGYDYTTQILLATEDKNEIAKTGIYYSELWDIVNSNEFANLMIEQGQGGAWNKGLTNSDPRVRKNSENMSKAKRKAGFYKTCAKYLPHPKGDKNPAKKPEVRSKLSSIAKSRYRIYREDGSWYWGRRPQ